MDDDLLPASPSGMLEQVLNVGIEWARRARDRSVTVVAIAVDDTVTLRRDFGAPRVEELLGVVAARLAKLQQVAAVRSGDSFVLVSTAPRSRFDAFSLAERAARVVSRPLAVDGFEFVPTASMGIRVSQGLSGTAPTLLADAEVALDEASRRGPGEIVMYNPSLHGRRVDENADMRLQFEPVVALDDGHVSTYEAVVAAGPTGAFGDAEGEDFDCLLDAVARTIAGWPTDIDVSFNVTQAQLLDPAFAHQVGDVADRASIARERLVFEIDERHAAADLLEMERALTRLRDDDWRVGIDRLGAGEAPLDTLAMLPVQFVKIDRSLVDHADDAELELLATVSAAARSLSVATIASGISTLPELALAIAHDYNFAQGTLFGVQVSSPPAAGPSRD